MESAHESERDRGRKNNSNNTTGIYFFSFTTMTIHRRQIEMMYKSHEMKTNWLFCVLTMGHLHMLRIRTLCKYAKEAKLILVTKQWRNIISYIFFSLFASFFFSNELWPTGTVLCLEEEKPCFACLSMIFQSLHSKSFWIRNVTKSFHQLNKIKCMEGAWKVDGLRRFTTFLLFHGGASKLNGTYAPIASLLSDPYNGQ